MLAPPHPSPELVQLGKPEPVGPVNQHHRGVGHINAHFHHRRSHQNVQCPVPELPHRLVLIPRRHPPVQQPQPQVGKHFPRQPLVLVHRGARVQLLRFLNQRADDERLPPGRHLLPHKPVGGPALVLRHNARHYLLAPRRQFVYGGNIQVAVQRQLQRARYRRGRHHQGVGLLCAPPPQCRPLLYPEAVLLVGDRQRQVGHLHPILDERVRAYQQIQMPFRRHPQRFPARLRPRAARQQPHGKGTRQVGQIRRQQVVLRPGLGKPAQQLPHRAEMLLRQHFRGRHQRRLPLRRCGRQHRRQGHQGFAAAHFALQQAAHGRRPPRHIAGDFADAAQLRPGGRERHTAQKAVHGGRLILDRHASGVALPVPPPSQNRQLERQDFVKGQPPPRPFRRRGVRRIMDIADSVRQPNQPGAVEQRVGQRVHHGVEITHNGLPGQAAQVPRRHPLRQPVDGNNAPGVEGRLARAADFVVAGRQRQPPLLRLRLAGNHQPAAHPQRPRQIPLPEPLQLNIAGIVAQDGFRKLYAPLPHAGGTQVGQLPFQSKIAAGINVPDGGNIRPVVVAARQQIQQIPHRVDAQGGQAAHGFGVHTPDLARRVVQAAGGSGGGFRPGISKTPGWRAAGSLRPRR